LDLTKYKQGLDAKMLVGNTKNNEIKTTEKSYLNLS
jgi:hypothetical protein